MTPKRVTWLLAIVVVSLVSLGVILAEESDPEIRTKVVTSDGRGSWMGVRLKEVTADKARELKLPGEYGAVVTHVEEDGPAAKAGVEANDVILEFAGERVRSVAQLHRLVRETPPGRTVTLAVGRNGQTRTLNLKLEARRGEEFFGSMAEPPVPPDFTFSVPPVHIPRFDFGFGPGRFGPSRLGILADDLTSQLAEYFGVKQGKGVLVREVRPASSAEKAGLKAGDCIVRVDDTEVGSVGDLRAALNKESGEKLDHTLTVVRDRQEQTVKVVLKPLERHARPETADDDFGDDIANLQKYAPEAQTEAERLRRELEAQSHEWQAELLAHKAELEGLQKEMASQSQAQLRQQAAEMARQAQKLKKQVERETLQWKKERLGQQQEIEKQLRELRNRAAQALEPVI